MLWGAWATLAFSCLMCTILFSPARVSGSCAAWDGSRAAISEGSSGRDGGGGAIVVPHTMVGSRSRDAST